MILRLVVLVGFLAALGAFYTLLQEAGIVGEQSQERDEPVFADVPEDHPQRGPIEMVVSTDIMQGVNDDLFNPDAPVTRAEFAEIVVRTMGWEVQADLRPGFEDVEERAYLDREDYIAVVSSRGVMLGVQNEPPRFGPDQELQAGHAVIVFVRAAREYMPDPEPQPDPDIVAQDYSAALEEALTAAAANGLLGGTGLDPTGGDMSAPITRAQAAGLAANVRALLDEDGETTAVESDGRGRA
ncbi:MAG: hypothetical protein Kow00129_00430 [Thermoleophilia bacterium]